MKTLKLLSFAALAALLATLSPIASATDGVVLINQATGTAGLPGCVHENLDLITICQSGSYRLSGNLSPSGNASGIHITASNVTLDLNGFTIAGATVNGDGVISDAGTSGVTIENGTLVGFSSGVALGGNGILERLSILNSAVVGVFVEENSLVENCFVLPGPNASYALYFANLGAYGLNNLAGGVRAGTSMGNNACGASVC